MFMQKFASHAPEIVTLKHAQKLRRFVDRLPQARCRDLLRLDLKLLHEKASSHSLVEGTCCCPHQGCPLTSPECLTV